MLSIKLKLVRTPHSRDLKQCAITILQEMDHLLDKGTTFRTAIRMLPITGHTIKTQYYAFTHIFFK